MNKNRITFLDVKIEFCKTMIAIHKMYVAKHNYKISLWTSRVAKLSQEKR